MVIHVDKWSIDYAAGYDCGQLEAKAAAKDSLLGAFYTGVFFGAFCTVVAGVAMYLVIV